MYDVHHVDLTIGTHKKRGALPAKARVRRGGLTRTVVLYNLHLGLTASERGLQRERLLASHPLEGLQRRSPVVFGGDLNDMWGTLGPRFLRPAGFSRAGPLTRTFPAWLPVRPLDALRSRAWLLLLASGRLRGLLLRHPAITGVRGLLMPAHQLTKGIELRWIGWSELEPRAQVGVRHCGRGCWHGANSSPVPHSLGGQTGTTVADALATHVMPHRAGLPGVFLVHLGRALDAYAKVRDVAGSRREGECNATRRIGHGDVRAWQGQEAAGATLVDHPVTGARHAWARLLLLCRTRLN